MTQDPFSPQYGESPQPGQPQPTNGHAQYDDSPFGNPQYVQPAYPQYPQYPQYPVQPPRAPRRGLMVAALVVVPLVLAAAVIGGVYAFTGAKGDGPGGPVAGQLRKTFPTKPSVGWRLNAGEVLPGGVFVRPDVTSQRYHGSGFTDLGDVLITTARSSDFNGPSELVAIDSGTGRVRWSAGGVGETPVCATATINGQLPCMGDDEVLFVNMADGRISSRTPLPGVDDIEVHDGAVYTDSFTKGDGGNVVTRGSAQNLTAAWRADVPWSSNDAECPGSGDTSYFGVNDEAVLSGSDIGVRLLKTDDGRRLVDHDLQSVKFHSGLGFTGRVCRSTSDFDRVVTEVFDVDGKPLRTHDLDLPAADQMLVTPSANKFYVIGLTAFDFASGRELWTAIEPAITQVNTIVGNVALGSGGYSDAPLAGFDVETGEHLWTTSIGGRPEMSDGASVMMATADSLTSVNLTTGVQEWTLPLDDTNGFMSRAGDGFASAASDSIIYYGPTGGASVAPGRIDPGTTTSASGGGLITKCGKTPEMKPVEYRAENGELVVKMELKASCPGGDIVSTNALRVTIRDNQSLIASGVFDFSKDPVTLGRDGAATTMDLRFGKGTIWRHPNTLGGGTGSGSGGGGPTTTATASGNELVDCDDEGSSAGPTSAKDQTSGSTDAGTLDTSGGGVACSDGEALDALRVQVDTDRPYVQSGLADHWVAQLSAKQPGLVAPDVDGRVLTWTPCEILRQHLEMRLQYPEVRLVWSDEWQTFDLRGWWVTIAGVTFGDPNSANGWCDQRAIPVDECFAKVVSNGHDSRGTTKYRR